jgi:hypothetical protein
MHSTVDSVRFQHLAPAQRSFLLSHSSVANARVSLTQNRASHEERDRVWRRWITFCAEAGLDSDPFLSKLQQHETELVMRAFYPSTECG